MQKFRQPEGTFSLYDPGSPRAAPDVSTRPRKAAVALEDLIRKDLSETGAFFDAKGALLLSKQGKPGSVGFTRQEMDNVARASLFTHNHPNGSPFSVEDIGAAFGTYLEEVRVVTTYARYSMQVGKGWQRMDVLEVALAQAENDVQQGVRNAIIGGELHQSQYGNEVRHRAWQKIAWRFGLVYQREAS